MGQQHTIDKLNLDISVKSSEANVSKINRLSQSLDKFAGIISRFPTENFKRISKNLVQLSSAINVLTSDNKQISGLSSRLGNLNKKIGELDVGLMKSKFSQMASAISPFIEKISSAQSSLVALNGIINGSNKIQDNTNPTAKKGGGLFKYAKWSAVYLIARRLGRVVYGISQAGSDYTETLNLWETAMGANLNTATKFVDKMNEAYGVSEKTLMNAQAIFKNMLGSLGQISDQTAYLISEGVSQMALDYASLFNQTFEQSFTKFQAALAGQVRPIRSVAGFDITENTLFQLYQSLGGTKTMRQLSRTEKQLLSLLAIFNQMQASGAIGDLDKTMSSFANQSRVAAEAFNELKTWAGTLLTYVISESKIMVKINALIIFAARYLEAIARSIGAIQSFAGKDPFASTTQGAEDATKAINELQGKLLDFDKFRSLNGAGESNVALDEKLINAFSTYESVLSNASLEARELSNQWFRALGYTIDENGELELTDEQIKDIKDNIGNIVKMLGSFDGLDTIKSLTPLLSTLGTILINLAPTLTVILSTMSPIISSLSQVTAEIVVALDEIGLLKYVIIGIIGLNIGKKLWSLIGTVANVVKSLSGLYSKMSSVSSVTMQTQTAFSLLTGLLTYSVADALFSNMSEDMKKIIAPLTTIISLVTGLSVAWLAMHGAMSAGVAVPVIMGSIGVGIASLKAMLDINKFADGGLPNKGSLFIANEAGPELVANIGGGQSGVMNMEQLENAVARGMIVGLSSVDMRDDRPIYINIDGNRFFSASRDIYKQNGYDVTAVK